MVKFDIFFFKYTATTEIYTYLHTLSLHDALPIYAAPRLTSVGFPDLLTRGPELGGLVNLPAIFIIAVVAALLMLGTHESARLNSLLVLIKIATLSLFVAIALDRKSTRLNSSH